MLALYTAYQYSLTSIAVQWTGFQMLVFPLSALKYFKVYISKCNMEKSPQMKMFNKCKYNFYCFCRKLCTMQINIKYKKLFWLGSLN